MVCSSCLIILRMGAGSPDGRQDPPLRPGDGEGGKGTVRATAFLPGGEVIMRGR